MSQPLDQALAPYGALALRLSLGVMWLAHASLKWFVFGLAGFAGWLDSQGLPALMAWPVFLLEVGGGIAIITGFYGRYVSLVLLPILLGAIAVHAPNGWLHTSAGGGWEYPAFLIAASLVHGLLGDGAWALRTRASLLASAPAN